MARRLSAASDDFPIHGFCCAPNDMFAFSLNTTWLIRQRNQSDSTCWSVHICPFVSSCSAQFFNRCLLIGQSMIQFVRLTVCSSHLTLWFVDSILENQIIQFKWTVGRIPAWCGIKLPFGRPVKSQLLNQYSIVLEQLLHSYLMARERWSFQPKWPVTYSSVLQIKYASSDWNASACCSSNFLAFDGCPVWPKSSITSFWERKKKEPNEVKVTTSRDRSRWFPIG